MKCCLNFDHIFSLNNFLSIKLILITELSTLRKEGDYAEKLSKIIAFLMIRLTLYTCRHYVDVSQKLMKYKWFTLKKIVWLVLVSSFNGISTFVGHLIS